MTTAGNGSTDNRERVKCSDDSASQYAVYQCSNSTSSRDKNTDSSLLKNCQEEQTQCITEQQTQCIAEDLLHSKITEYDKITDQIKDFQLDNNAEVSKLKLEINQMTWELDTLRLRKDINHVQITNKEKYLATIITSLDCVNHDHLEILKSKANTLFQEIGALIESSNNNTPTSHLATDNGTAIQLSENTNFRKKQTISEESLECPICFEIKQAPVQIFQCYNGHIFCSECKSQMQQCPECRINITTGNFCRNLRMEDIINNLFHN